MKIGAEDKKKLGIMAVLLVVAAIALIYLIRSLSTGAPAAASVKPTQPAARPQSALRRPGQPIKENPLDPTLHLAVLTESRKVQYDVPKRNIFRMEELAPEKLPAPLVPVTVPGPPLPPPPPNINLKFYGFSAKQGEPKKVFLSEGEEIFVAREGDIIKNRYKIVKITPTSVDIEDMLFTHRQTIPLTAPPPAG